MGTRVAGVSAVGTGSTGMSLVGSVFASVTPTGLGVVLLGLGSTGTGLSVSRRVERVRAQGATSPGSGSMRTGATGV